MVYNTKKFIAPAFIIFLFACGPRVYSPEAKLDTPSHHVENGMRLLNAGKVEAAFREFSRAKELDTAYAPAYVGLGLCYGLKGDFEKGLEIMKEVERYTRKNGSPDSVPRNQ